MSETPAAKKPVSEDETVLDPPAAGASGVVAEESSTNGVAEAEPVSKEPVSKEPASSLTSAVLRAGEAEAERKLALEPLGVEVDKTDVMAAPVIETAVESTPAPASSRGPIVVRVFGRTDVGQVRDHRTARGFDGAMYGAVRRRITGQHQTAWAREARRLFEPPRGHRIEFLAPVAHTGALPRPCQTTGQRCGGRAMSPDLVRQCFATRDADQRLFEYGVRCAQFTCELLRGLACVTVAARSREIGDVVQQRARSGAETATLQFAEVVVQTLRGVVGAREDHGLDEVELAPEPLFGHGAGFR